MRKKNSVKHPIPKVVDTIVVGGVANGVLVKNVDIRAQTFDLGRPTHIKPLHSSDQSVPEIEREHDTYRLHVIELQNDHEKHPHMFGIAVIDGESLTWAFVEMCAGHAQRAVNQLAEKGGIIKH